MGMPGLNSGADTQSSDLSYPKSLGYLGEKNGFERVAGSDSDSNAILGVE